MAYTYINYNINQLPDNLKEMIEESSRADLIEQSKDYVEYPFEWVTNFQFDKPYSGTFYIISMVFIIPIGQGSFQVVPCWEHSPWSRWFDPPRDETDTNDEFQPIEYVANDLCMERPYRYEALNPNCYPPKPTHPLATKGGEQEQPNSKSIVLNRR